VNAPADYELAGQLTFRVLERFKMFGPEFQFPPKEIAFIASIADVGKHLARNATAHAVIRELISECDRLKLCDYPTTMMLRVCLEDLDIPIKWVPFDELGIAVRMVRGPKA
jgi:hypothetical protein